MNARHWVCGLSLLGFWACVEQPQGHCQVAQKQGEAHFVVYTPIVPMEGDACQEKALTTEKIGFESYQLPGKDKISIAWRTETLQQHFDLARESEGWDYNKSQETSLSLNVQADYSSKPDEENRCYIFDNSNPDPRSFRLSAKFEAFETLPKKDKDGNPIPPEPVPAAIYNYEWRNMVVYSMPASPGQLVEGEVTYTLMEGGETCTGTYSFVALWPAHQCKKDEDCTPSVGGKEGSPINPDFAGSLRCHPARFCTVTRPPAELIRALSK